MPAVLSTHLGCGGGLLRSREPRSGSRGSPAWAARARRAVPLAEQVGNRGIDLLEGGDLKENFKA